METAARPSGAGMSVQEGLSAIGATALFEKVLTASDTAGRIIIPKVRLTHVAPSDINYCKPDDHVRHWAWQQIWPDRPDMEHAS